MLYKRSSATIPARLLLSTLFLVQKFRFGFKWFCDHKTEYYCYPMVINCIDSLRTSKKNYNIYISSHKTFLPPNLSHILLDDKFIQQNKIQLFQIYILRCSFESNQYITTYGIVFVYSLCAMNTIFMVYRDGQKQSTSEIVKIYNNQRVQKLCKQDSHNLL